MVCNHLQNASILASILASMSTSTSAQKLQAKLFGNGAAIPHADKGLGTDPNLTLNIPKLVVDSADTNPVSKNGVSQPDKAQSTRPQSTKSYRQVLLDKLGTKYEGVERYRLDQDGAKERHWKRWGPYLSERQWVSTLLSLPLLLIFASLIVGDCS